MATSGTILSLDAIGKQDLYMDSPNPQDSLFNYNLPERHAKFSHYENIFTSSKPLSGVSNYWPFDSTVTMSLSPRDMGDFMTSLSLRIDLPTLADKDDKLTTYCSKVGWHFIKSLNIKIDEVDIITIHGDTLMIEYELTKNTSERRALDAMLGGDTADAHTVIIRLPTGFTKTNPLPLCAMHKQKIRVSIDFNPISFFTDSTGDILINNIQLITGLIDVDPMHRLSIIEKPIQRTFTTIIKQPVLQIPANTNDARLKYNLVGSDKVRAFIWFLRRVEVEQETDISMFKNRFNLSNHNSPDIDVQLLNPILNTTALFVNSQASEPVMDDPLRADISTRNFSKFTPGFYNPTRDVFSFSHALHPLKDMPSGMLDMSKTVSNATFIQISLNRLVVDDVQFYMYFMVDRAYNIERGLLST